MNLTSPNGGFDLNRIDPRIAMVVIGGAVVGFLVFVGDQIAFVRPPNNLAENILGILPMLFFMLSSDRVTANVITGIVYTIFVGCVSLFGWRLLVQKLIEPMQIKQMIDTKKREKKLINKYGDDTM